MWALKFSLSHAHINNTSAHAHTQKANATKVRAALASIQSVDGAQVLLPFDCSSIDLLCLQVEDPYEDESDGDADAKPKGKRAKAKGHAALAVEAALAAGKGKGGKGKKGKGKEEKDKAGPFCLRAFPVLTLLASDD
jgi:hypothetical protein